MVIGLEKVFREFSRQIVNSKDSHSSFFDYPVLYDHFVAYIQNDQKDKKDISVDEFLSRNLRIQDVIEACVFYCQNSNVNKVSGINKYLRALSKFCNEFMKQNYPNNSTLYATLPFAQFTNDVRAQISNKEIEDSKSNPAISESDVVNLCAYLKKHGDKTIAHKQISIMLKLIVLYGFKLEKIRFFYKSDYDFKTNKLFVRGTGKNKIKLELHDSLYNEIENYLNDPRCNTTDFMFLNSKGGTIQPAFFSSAFRRIEKEYGSDVRFTTTGVAKYAIINMLKNGLNREQVKIITGMESTVIDNCDKEATGVDNSKLEDDINLAIKKIRTTTGYDKLIRKAED